MNVKHLSALIVTGTIALGAAPAIADSSDTPQFNFSCKMSEGIPTTFAQPVGKDISKPVFHWKQDALQYKSSSTPQELCDNVTAKLEDYSAQGYDLSEISFVGTKAVDNMPAICATSGQSKNCSKLLFTLSPTATPSAEVVAAEVVTAILNPQLQGEKTVYRDRGVQSTSYQVNFWQLLGLGPNKFFSK